MIESVSEVPLIDDAFYYAFCSGKAGGKAGSKISLDSPEGRSELLMSVEKVIHV